jgi:hypothetical protein
MDSIEMNMPTYTFACLLLLLLLLNSLAAFYLALTTGDVPTPLVTIVTTLIATLAGLYATPPRLT